MWKKSALYKVCTILIIPVINVLSTIELHLNIEYCERTWLLFNFRFLIFRFLDIFSPKSFVPSRWVNLEVITMNIKTKKKKKMDAKYEPLSLRHYILIRKGVKLPRKRSLMHSWEYFLFKSEIWVSSNGRTLNSVFILVNKINIDQQT